MVLLVWRRAAAADARVGLHRVAPVGAARGVRRGRGHQGGERVGGGGVAEGGRLWDGGDGDAPVLAAALDALVGVLVQLREVLPHVPLLVRGAAEVSELVEPVCPGLQRYCVEHVLVGLRRALDWFGGKASQRTLRFHSWENGFPQSSSLQVYGLAWRWTSRCALTFPRWAKFFPQMSQWYGRSPVWRRWCVWNGWLYSQHKTITYPEVAHLGELLVANIAGLRKSAVVTRAVGSHT